MALSDTIREAFEPLFHRGSNQLQIHAINIANRIRDLESAVSDLGRGDINDHWQRIQVKKTFAGAEIIELGVCPRNEIWLIQAIAADGVQEKSPAFTLEAENVLIMSVPKEGLGNEGIGGDQAILTGERLFMNVRAAGSINCTITFIRQQKPEKAVIKDMGRGTEQYSPNNTHEVSRDLIESRSGLWTEPAPETAATEGRTG